MKTIAINNQCPLTVDSNPSGLLKTVNNFNNRKQHAVAAVEKLFVLCESDLCQQIKADAEEIVEHAVFHVT